jgi:hypothetical protein
VSELKERGVYKQAIIDIVYNRGCVTRKTILRELYEKFEERFKDKSRDYLEFIVDSTLQRLVEHGVVVKKNRGLYCRP